jgi:hypothetical protein
MNEAVREIITLPVFKTGNEQRSANQPETRTRRRRHHKIKKGNGQIVDSSE